MVNIIIILELNYLKIIFCELIFLFVSVIASNTTIVTSRNSDSVFFETHQLGPWSEILENWIVSEKGNLNARNSRVMKFGDKTLTISPKPNSPNKRDVSETDLYLLGKFYVFYSN